jgi:4-hydroxythreonine-4-phosphate dehydrogenase
VFEYYARLGRLRVKFRSVPAGSNGAELAGTGKSARESSSIPVLEPTLASTPRITPGEQKLQAGTFAGKSLEAAVAAWRNGLIDAVVTAPTSKTVMHRAGYSASGQTEILASLTATKHYGMMLLSGAFRVGLATVHVPLREVSSSLTTGLLVDKAKILANSLVHDFRIRRPRIAILGVNPHAGESGLLGDEEMKVIAPAITIIRKSGIQATGPYPADGFFGTHAHEGFDAILAMYHDQGLIPLKMSGFKTGVNFSMGLPIVRTSPDHGTAFSLAGKHAGDPSSIIEAIRTAVAVAANRRTSR